MARLTVNLCGIELDNPIIPASGTLDLAMSSRSSMTSTASAPSPSKAQQRTPGMAIQRPESPNLHRVC